MRIFKYHVEDMEVDLPFGAKILDLQIQYGEPVFWAMVDPDAPKVKRRLLVVNTGSEFDADEREYIGTFQTHSGDYVQHVFIDAQPIDDATLLDWVTDKTVWKNPPPGFAEPFAVPIEVEILPREYWQNPVTCSKDNP